MTDEMDDGRIFVQCRMPAGGSCWVEIGSFIEQFVELLEESATETGLLAEVRP